MGKQHFDPAPLPGRTFEGLGTFERAPMLAFGLEKIACDNPLLPFGAARLQCASAAILGARPIGHGAVLAYQASVVSCFPPGQMKTLACGSKVKSARVKKPLVGRSRWSSGICGSIPRRISHPINQPRSIGGIGGQPLRFEAKHSCVRSSWRTYCFVHDFGH
jgi:hypothetical protein